MAELEAQKMTESEMKQFTDITSKRYKDQGIFFLNAYWDEFEGQAEKIWDYVQSMQELDAEDGAEGSDLQEIYASRFLEKTEGAMTVMSFRNKMRAIDLDYNRRMALIEFLVFNYEKPIPDLLSKPQGMNETLLKAQRALEAVQNEIATLKAKEADLRKKSSGTGVRATTAKQELNAFLSADKTELNRAFLTAEAAVRAAKKLGGDVAQGFVWYLERELTEAKKYKPKSKGGIAK
eukprot:71808_1